ncbi:MAG: HAMP domain-containing histidine kinase [Campylobacterales bacterium]|nr:HAMP domain-containing histidine kinase [Campylobacterales bacterium]
MNEIINSYKLKLFIIFLVVISPFVVFNLYEIVQVRQKSLQQSINSANTVIQSLHRHHTVLLETVERELSILAHIPSVQSDNYYQCSDVLKSILTNTKFFTNIALSDGDRKVLCTAKKGMKKVSKMAVAVFDEVRKNKTFAVGQGAVSENHGLAIIPFGYPVKEHKKLENPVLMAGVSLLWLNKKSYDINLHPSMRVYVINGKKNVIGTIPSEKDLLGKKLPSNVEIPKNRENKLLETEDGVWIFGDSVHEMQIIVYIDKNKLFADINTLFYQSLFMVIVMIVVAQIMAMWVSKRLILHEVERLMSISTSKIRMASVSELLVNISHHWRNPLNNISLLMELIKEKIESENSKEEILELAENVSKTTITLGGTIDHFSSCFDKGQKGVFDINNSVETALALLEPRFEEEKIQLKNSLSKDLNIDGDENEMVQVISHILNNGIDSIVKKNSSEKWIKISGEKKEKNIFLSIEDSGEGLDPKIESKLFEPYVTTKFMNHGIGVSLYLVKSIIEKDYQGSIKAKNTDDGCVFLITLPVN